MTLKTMLVIAHVLGVTFGVGGVAILDAYMLRYIRGAAITPSGLDMIRFISVFVKVGLVAVWASGIAIIGFAPDGAASILANPKVQAKLVIVVVLTLNALAIETVALPLVARNLGTGLFAGVGQMHRTLLLASAAVSSASWFFPLVLGLARELNHVVPAYHILAVYAAAVALGAFALQVVGRLAYRPLAVVADAQGKAIAEVKVQAFEPDPASTMAHVLSSQAVLMRRSAQSDHALTHVPLEARVSVNRGSTSMRAAARAAILVSPTPSRQ